MTTTPPKKLSKWLRLAVDEVNALDRTTHEPFFATWVSGLGTGTCAVCLAGGVILRHPAYTPMWDSTWVGPLATAPAWQNGIRAIEDARRGAWAEAIERIHPDEPIPGHLAGGRESAFTKPQYARFETWQEFDLYTAELQEDIRLLEEAGF